MKLRNMKNRALASQSNEKQRSYSGKKGWYNVHFEASNNLLSPLLFRGVRHATDVFSAIKRKNTRFKRRKM